MEPALLRADFSQNSILARLAGDKAFTRLSNNLKARTLSVRQTVQEEGKPMNFVHFPLSGMVSSTVQMEDGDSVEVSVVGSHGMVNWESLLGQRNSQCRHFGQLRGEFTSISTRDLLPFALHPAIAGYISMMSGELAQTAACNCLHHIDERLARWLLVAADKTGSDDMALTQEFLAMMLGARRATVTIAAGKLQKAGFIHYRRGNVRILDRQGLTDAACECYPAIAAMNGNSKP